MKTVKISILLWGLTLIVASCDNGWFGTEDHDGHVHKTGSAKTPGVPVKLKDDNLNATYQQYWHLEDALITGNMTEAKIAALAFEAGARQIRNGAAMAAEAGRIIEAGNIERQRVIFASLSSEFIALLKKTGLDSGKLYILHCPMALHDKGAYWLSSSKEIRNPYYGENMLNCGSVKEAVN